MAEIKPVVIDDCTDNDSPDSYDQAHNSIWADQVLLADQPSPTAGAAVATAATTVLTTIPSETASGVPEQRPPESAADSGKQRPRAKNTRSLRAHNSLTSGASSFEFVPQINGRFTLIKDNTLRIKRLRADDSGLYTCRWGSLHESIELSVVSRRELVHYEDNM